jgi:hypothetical protein
MECVFETIMMACVCTFVLLFFLCKEACSSTHNGTNYLLNKYIYILSYQVINLSLDSCCTDIVFNLHKLSLLLFQARQSLVVSFGVVFIQSKSVFFVIRLRRLLLTTIATTRQNNNKNNKNKNKNKNKFKKWITP